MELKKAKKNILLSEVVTSIRRVEKKCEVLLVEGSGGLMVPLGEGYLVEDVIGKLKCAVIVVARNRLGTINHTLLTVERLRARGIKNGEVRVALMDGPGRDESSASNGKTLARLLEGVLVASVGNLGGNLREVDGIKRGSQREKAVLRRLILENRRENCGYNCL